MAKIAGVAILYHPDEEVLLNMASYRQHLDQLYVFDNSTAPNAELISQIKALPGILYLADGQNRGIAERLNAAARMAIANGFDWLLTMDQDSRFPEGKMERYLRCALSYQNIQSVGMFGVESEAAEKVQGDCKAKPVSELITSGSLLSLEKYGQVGGFDEKLFIDEVDLDYGYTLIKSGFRLVKFQNIVLQHTLGTISVHRSLKSGRLTQRVLHSPVRLYYIVRNHFYLTDKLSGSFDNEMKHKRKLLWNRLKNNILYNKDRLSVLRYSVKGYVHYRKGITGKLPD